MPVTGIVQRLARVGLLVLCFAVLSVPPTLAQKSGGDDFYKGRQFQILVGTQAGTGYDVYGRALARHIGRFLPGNPVIVTSNMTGAGGLLLANHLYNIAPRDGTVIGIFNRLTILDPMFGKPEAKFDSTKFIWIGSMGPEVSVCVAWKTTPFSKWDDLLDKEFIAGASSLSNDTGIYPMFLNTVLGTKMKIVVGYKGGADITAAIERGEVNGRCGWSWSSVKSTKPNWLADKSIHVLVQLGLKKAPDLQEVPLVIDLAKDERRQQILRLAFSPQLIAWPFVSPPNVPEATVALLRKAFMSTSSDPEFLADARKMKLDIDPMSGDDVQDAVSQIYQAKPDVIAEVRKIMYPKAK